MAHIICSILYAILVNQYFQIILIRMLVCLSTLHKIMLSFHNFLLIILLTQKARRKKLTLLVRLSMIFDCFDTGWSKFYKGHFIIPPVHIRSMNFRPKFVEISDHVSKLFCIQCGYRSLGLAAPRFLKKILGLGFEKGQGQAVISSHELFG